MDCKLNDLTFKVSPTNFKHTGIFPEQAANWDFIQTKVKEYKGNHNEMKVLNDGDSFGIIGSTICDNFNVKYKVIGSSILELLK